ncbi:MAG: hypothetical protein ACRDRA_03195 [Pseudonocardiaceae bacterium]
MTEPEFTQPEPEPVRIIDLLELARRQEWGQINGIITFFDTERLHRLAAFLTKRVEGDAYDVNGYYPWQRAMVDLLQRLNSLIAAREARDDWQTLENTVI